MVANISAIRLKKGSIFMTEVLNRFKYEPVREDLFSNDLGSFSSFGIKVFLVLNEKHEIGVASDVSDDPLIVYRIADYCNSRQVNPLELLNTVALFI